MRPQLVPALYVKPHVATHVHHPSLGRVPEKDMRFLGILKRSRFSGRWGLEGAGGGVGWGAPSLTKTTDTSRFPNDHSMKTSQPKGFRFFKFPQESRYSWEQGKYLCRIISPT